MHWGIWHDARQGAPAAVSGPADQSQWQQLRRMSCLPSFATSPFSSSAPSQAQPQAFSPQHPP